MDIARKSYIHLLEIGGKEAAIRKIYRKACSKLKSYISFIKGEISIEECISCEGTSFEMEEFSNESSFAKGIVTEMFMIDDAYGCKLGSDIKKLKAYLEKKL